MGVSRSGSLIGNLQAALGFEKFLLAPHLFEGFRAFGQRRFVEQRQQRREAIAVDKTENLDIAPAQPRSSRRYRACAAPLREGRGVADDRDRSTRSVAPATRSATQSRDFSAAAMLRA